MTRRLDRGDALYQEQKDRCDGEAAERFGAERQFRREKSASATCVASVMTPGVVKALIHKRRRLDRGAALYQEQKDRCDGEAAERFGAERQEKRRGRLRVPCLCG